MSTSSIRDWLKDVELARRKGLLQKPQADKIPGEKRVRGKRPQERSSTAPRRSERILNLASSSATPRAPRNRRPQQTPAPLRTASRGGKRSSITSRATGTGVTSTNKATVFEQLISAGIREASPLELDTLPDDAHDLFLAVQSIANGVTSTIPAAVIDRIRTPPFPVPDHQRLDTYHLPDEAATHEFIVLVDLKREAARCVSAGASESHWNVAVHYPLLRMALKGLPCETYLKVWDITTATIIPEYVPRNQTTLDPLSARKVDFCLALEPKESTHDFLARLGLQAINQTVYTPLLSRPIAVSIETKRPVLDGSGVDQLMVWTRAWFARLSDMVPEATMPTLPVVRIIRHNWDMRWVWMEPGDVPRMRYSPGVIFGKTDDLLGMYRIMAVIRALAEWVEEVFEPWTSKTFQNMGGLSCVLGS